MNKAECEKYLKRLKRNIDDLNRARSFLESVEADTSLLTNTINDTERNLKKLKQAVDALKERRV